MKINLNLILIFSVLSSSLVFAPRTSPVDLFYKDASNNFQRIQNLHVESNEMNDFLKKITNNELFVKKGEEYFLKFLLDTKNTWIIADKAQLNVDPFAPFFVNAKIPSPSSNIIINISFNSGTLTNQYLHTLNYQIKHFFLQIKYADGRYQKKNLFYNLGHNEILELKNNNLYHFSPKTKLETCGRIAFIATILGGMYLGIKKIFAKKEPLLVLTKTKQNSKKTLRLQKS